MDPATLLAFGTALKTLGPWGTIVVLGYAIGWLYSEKQAEAKLAREEKQRLNDRLVKMAEKQGAVAELISKNQAALIHAIGKHDDFTNQRPTPEATRRLVVLEPDEVESGR